MDQERADRVATRSALRRNALLALTTVVSFGLASCSTPAEETIERTVLLSEINLVFGEDDNGRLDGIDLDESDDADGLNADSCFKPDATAPDGRAGIDNQFAFIGGLIAGQLGGDPDALVQASINDGRILILFELIGLNDPLNDDNVTVRIHFGSGPVNVGTDGLPEPGQSFDIRANSPPIEVRNVRLVDGRMEVRGFDITVEVNVLQAFFLVNIRNAHLILDVDEDGFATGILGGGIDREELRTIIAEDEVLAEALSTVEPFLRTIGDLEPDGTGLCSQVSWGFRIGGRPAFILPE